MKTLLLVLGLALAALQARAGLGNTVTSDTAWYPDKRIKYVIRQDMAQKTEEVLAWYPDGRVILHARCSLVNGSYAPAEDVTVYYPNGKVRQAYDIKKGILSNYDDKGRLTLRDNLAPGAEQWHEYEYFENGTVMSDKCTRTISPGNGLVLSRTNNEPWWMIYLQSHGGMVYTREYYPGGRMMHESTLAGNMVTHLFYNPDGTRDTATFISRDFKKNGTFRTYFPNGKLSRTEHYKDNYAHGQTLVWHPNGQPEAQYSSINGSIDGFFYRWNNTGMLLAKTYYRHGQNDGPAVTFHDDGSLLEQGSAGYAGAGLSVYYNSGGGIDLERSETGRPPLYFDYRPAARQTCPVLRHTGAFKNQLREGRWQAFYPSGRPVYDVYYKDSFLDGPYTLWDTAGNLMVKGAYKAGWPDGYFEYYLHGQPETSGWYRKGLKDSLWTSYADGKIIKIEDYSHGSYDMVEEYRDGRLIQKRDTDLANRQLVWNYYDKDGALYSRATQPYGQKHRNLYTYEKGRLTRQQVYYDDGNGLSLVTTYYPGGQKNCEVQYKGEYAEGEVVCYYPNGRKKSEGRYVQSELDGPLLNYNEKGRYTGTRLYRNGIEIIKPADTQDSAATCYCNIQPGQAVRYAQWAGSFLDYKIIDTLPKLFYLDTAALNHLFFDNYQANSMSLITWQNLHIYLRGQKGMAISLAPCRNGSNHALVPMYYRYEDELRDVYHIDIDSFDYSPYSWYLLGCRVRQVKMTEMLKNANTLLDSNIADAFLQKNYGFSEGFVRDDEEGFYFTASSREGLDAEEDFRQRLDSSCQARHIENAEDDFLKRFYDEVFAVAMKRNGLETTMEGIVLAGDNINGYGSMFFYELQRMLKGTATVTMAPETIAIELPPALLRQWNPATRRARKDAAGKYVPARILMQTQELEYTNAPADNIHITRKKGSPVCMSASELAGTGILFSAADVTPDLDTLQGPDNVYVAGGNKFMPRWPATGNGDTTEYAEAEYLRRYMGLYIPAGTLTLPGRKDSATYTCHDILLNGNYIEGRLTCGSTQKASLEKQLRRKGLRITHLPAVYHTSKEDTAIYWRWENKQ